MKLHFSPAFSLQETRKLDDFLKHSLSGEFRELCTALLSNQIGGLQISQIVPPQRRLLLELLVHANAVLLSGTTLLAPLHQIASQPQNMTVRRSFLWYTESQINPQPLPPWHLWLRGKGYLYKWGRGWGWYCNKVIEANNQLSHRAAICPPCQMITLVRLASGWLKRTKWRCTVSICWQMYSRGIAFDIVIACWYAVVPNHLTILIAVCANGHACFVGEVRDIFLFIL